MGKWDSDDPFFGWWDICFCSPRGVTFWNVVLRLTQIICKNISDFNFILYVHLAVNVVLDKTERVWFSCAKEFSCLNIGCIFTNSAKETILELNVQEKLYSGVGLSSSLSWVWLIPSTRCCIVIFCIISHYQNHYPARNVRVLEFIFIIFSFICVKHLGPFKTYSYYCSTKNKSLWGIYFCYATYTCNCFAMLLILGHILHMKIYPSFIK